MVRTISDYNPDLVKQLHDEILQLLERVKLDNQTPNLSRSEIESKVEFYKDASQRYQDFTIDDFISKKPRLLINRFFSDFFKQPSNFSFEEVIEI